MKTYLVAFFLSFSMIFSGCALNQEQTGTFGGSVVGGGLGAAAGNLLDCKGCALIGGLVGAAIGGSVGGNIGRHMDQQDAARVSNTVNTAHTGQTVRWTNPDTNIRYDVTPTRTYKSTTTNDYCREVTIGEARVGGKRQEVYGTACRQPDGSWKMKQ